MSRLPVEIFDNIFKYCNGNDIFYWKNFKSLSKYTYFKYGNNNLIIYDLILNGDLENVKNLIDKNDFCPDTQEMCFIIAIAKKNIEITNFLIERKYDMNVNPYTFQLILMGMDNLTKQQKKYEKFMERYTKINYFDEIVNIVIYNKDYNKLKTLIKKNIRLFENEKYCELDLVKFYFNKIENPTNNQDNYQRLFNIVCKNGLVTILDYLIENGYITEDMYMLAFTTGIDYGNLSTINYFLEKGYVNIGDYSFNHLFHGGNIEVVKYFIEMGLFKRDLQAEEEGIINNKEKTYVLDIILAEEEGDHEKTDEIRYQFRKKCKFGIYDESYLFRIAINYGYIHLFDKLIWLLDDEEDHYIYELLKKANVKIFDYIRCNTTLLKEEELIKILIEDDRLEDLKYLIEGDPENNKYLALAGIDNCEIKIKDEYFQHALCHASIDIFKYLYKKLEETDLSIETQFRLKYKYKPIMSLIAK